MQLYFLLQVCFATCFDPNILSDLQQKEGKLLQLKPTSADVAYRQVFSYSLEVAFLVFSLTTVFYFYFMILVK